MPSLKERKREELAAKGAALGQEFEYWRGASDANQPFQKHHTQIARITARLESMLLAIATDVAKLDGNQLLARAGEFEEKILAAHLVWEFFRSKLAMRADPYLRGYLQACDEFAWSCYKAARDRFLATPAKSDSAPLPISAKEPPLVFLNNSGRSPFAVAREQAFELERPAFKVDAAALYWLTKSGEFHELIRQLPFPMVGVPWYQIAHLPDALVIGHEMGHVLEWDFNLKKDADLALAAAGLPAARRPAWEAWRLEVFADICGCLAGGPSFGNALMDFLATDEGRGAEAPRTAPAWKEYPVRGLRIELVAATLTFIGFPTHAAALLADWRDAFGPLRDDTGFHKDAGTVVKALICGPYPTLQGLDTAPPPLTAFLSYRKQDAAAAVGVPLDALFVDAIRSDEPAKLATAREMFAATRLLYEKDPAAFAAQNYSRRACEMIVTQIAPGTRGSDDKALEQVLAAETALGQTWGQSDRP